MGLRLPWAFGSALAAFLAFAQFRLILHVLGPDYVRSAEAAYGLTLGQPHWREVQNRVLAPYLVRVLSAVFPDYLDAHVAFTVLMLGVAGFLAFRLGWRHGGSLGTALLGLFGFHFGFAMLLSRPWLYAWDYVEAVVFLCFADFVLSERPWRWFAALYAVAIFNRESAFVIALWMVLDPLCRRELARRRGEAAVPLDRPKLLAGVIGIAAGAALIPLLRHWLFVEAAGPRIFPNTKLHDEQFERALMNLVPNLEYSFSSLTRPTIDMPFVVPLFVVLAAGSAVWLSRRDPSRFLAYGIAVLGLVGIAVTISILFETRVLVSLLPAILTAAIVGSAREPAREPASLAQSSQPCDTAPLRR